MARDERKTVTIQSLLESGAIIGHKDGNHGSQYPRVNEFGPVGVPFLTARSLSDGKIDIAGAPRLANEKAEALRFGFVAPGDVLLSHNATVGRVAVVPQFTGRVLIGTSLTYFRVDPSQILPRYLAAYFAGSHFQHQLASVMSQTTRNQVPITAQRRLSIIVPPLDEQRAIAHILGTVDDKIELNRRMNETLKAIARALFQSWFVDFDPVRAKAEGRDTGLPKHITDLFPGSFEDSELAEIPKGWAVSPLRDVTSYLSRGLGPAYIDVGGICVLNQKCIRECRIDFSKARRHDPSKKSVDGRTLRLLDVLVNSTGVGTLGRVAQILNLAEPAIVDSHVTVVRAAAGIDPWFLGIALTGREAEIEALGEGSTGQTELSRARLGELDCLVPPTGLQASFGRTVEPLLVRLSENDQTSNTLAALRDTLLPKLISGEIRVKDAEKIVETAA